MPSHEEQVTDPLYWNWVRGGLGLKYLTEGLESFVDDTLKSVQRGYIDDIRNNTPGLQEVRCTECTTANILPCPTPGMCNLRKRGKINICSYHDKTDKLKTSRPCPNSICDKIRVKIRLVISIGIQTLRGKTPMHKIGAPTPMKSANVSYQSPDMKTRQRLQRLIPVVY